MESERKEEIIKYLDKYGVPYHSLAVFGLIFETEDENDFIARIKRESDKRIERTLKVGKYLMHKLKPTTKNEPVLNEFFDFNILKEDQYGIIFEWFETSTGFRVNNFTDLIGVPMLNGNPFLLETVRKERSHICLAKKNLYGNLYINDNRVINGVNCIRTLGNIRVINGSLGIGNSMDNLGKLERVSQDVWFGQGELYQTNLKTLSPLRIVGGNLNLKNLDANCETIERVRGNLNIRKSRAYNFKNLKEVRGNILMSKASVNEVDFSNVKIGGKIKIYTDKL